MQNAMRIRSVPQVMFTPADREASTIENRKE